MKNNSIKLVAIIGVLTWGMMSCKKDLKLTPNYELTTAQVYSNLTSYTQAYAKVLGSEALTGNQGPSGQPDLPIGDEGQNVDFFRTYWCAQELSTDEAVTNWGDAGLADFHNMNWTTSNAFLEGLYYRSAYVITVANDFIRQSSDANLSTRGISGTDATTIRQYRAEARFVRAYQYWVMMDLFGNPPFATDADAVGSIVPPQTTSKALFSYIESELMAIAPLLSPGKSNTGANYGRPDQATAWALLARMYLNAQTYTGAARYADAMTYSKKVIDLGYSLIPNYGNLMLADNNNNTDEFIWTINYDGKRTQSYGGTTFMTHCQIGGSMGPTLSLYGCQGGWGGMRVTSALSSLFPANKNTTFPNNGNPDTRAEFWTDGQTPEITSISSFTGGGYGVNKYRNVTSTGAQGSDPNYSDVDFPVFRLSEMYLIYAEAQVRANGTVDATGLGYINNIRHRAYANASAGTVIASDVTLDFILDERGRELYWECLRRTDLIRYGIFTAVTSDPRSVWPYKAGAPGGTNSQSYRNLYPLPLDDVNANHNLKQNPGYN